MLSTELSFSVTPAVNHYVISSSKSSNSVCLLTWKIMHSKCSSKSRLQCRRLASEIKGLCYMPHALRCNIHTAVLFNSASIHCFVFWVFFLICISLLRSHRSIWIRFRERFILCHYYIFILFFYRHLLAIWLRSFHVHLASHNTI